jgi:primase-polymerase (primpol)-like protein
MTATAIPPKPRTYNGDLTRLPQALEYLRGEKIWVCWRWMWDGKKWTKPPLRADNPNRKASSSEPATWGTYEQALEQVRIGAADGIGFTLQGRGIGGVDLDACRNPKTRLIAPWATARLAQIPTGYCEATVSGAGLRILGTSTLANFARKFSCRTRATEPPSKCSAIRIII